MRYPPTGMRIDFLDNTLHGSSQTSSMTSHNGVDATNRGLDG